MSLHGEAQPEANVASWLAQAAATGRLISPGK